MTTPSSAYYDQIYLSPHLDDAILSCGGQIYRATEAGRSVLVVTITAGQPAQSTLSDFAHSQHHSWGLSAQEVIEARRAEDVAACRLLGADYAHWPWLDCIYRLDPFTGDALYRSDEDIFGELASVERSLVAKVATKLDTLPPGGQIIVPLTVGHHVDHQLTRAAAERQFAAGLFYYEDYPYIQRHPEMLAPLVPPADGWQASVIPLSEAALAARIEANRQYRSQIGQLFEDEETMATLIRQQMADTGGERLWHRDQGGKPTGNSPFGPVS